MNHNSFGRLNERIDRLRVAPLIAHTVRTYKADRQAGNQAYRAGLIDLDAAARLTPAEIRELLAACSGGKTVGSPRGWCEWRGSVPRAGVVTDTHDRASTVMCTAIYMGLRMG